MVLHSYISFHAPFLVYPVSDEIGEHTAAIFFLQTILHSNRKHVYSVFRLTIYLKYFYLFASDEKRFGQVHDLSQYFGMKSNFTCIDVAEKSDVSGLVHRALPRRRKRDPARTWTATSSSENQDSMRASCGGEPSSDTEVMDSQFIDFRRLLRASNAYADENNDLGSKNLIVRIFMPQTLPALIPWDIFFSLFKIRSLFSGD